jgi:asparagine synthase (glutamine-hydrolysing)
LPSLEQAVAWHYYGSEEIKASLFTTDFRNGLLHSSRHFNNYDGPGQWEAISYVNSDREFYLPNEMLRKLDRMTMSHSVEGRVPFAAPGVVSVAQSLTENQLVKNGVLKWALKQAYSDLLPKQILERPKHGFNVPIDKWLRSDWRELFRHTFSRDSRIVSEGWLRKNSLKAAEELLNSPTTLHGHTLFSLVVLNRWMELK